jgi:transposase
MMGRRESGQIQFLYAFDLDKVVPPDHLVRQIDGVLDLSWVHKELAPYYSHTGRPSIDPVLMIRMLLVGYVFALRSERRLCSEMQVNLAYRWFCKLSVEDQIPDHSVFSRARHERFVTAMLCGGCLRAWWRCASRLALSEAKRFRSMRA